MRKFFIFLLILFFIFPLNVKAVLISGTRGVTQAPSFTFNNVVFVPLSSFAIAYGLKESWDPKAKISSLESTEFKMAFRVGSAYALVNGKKSKMPAQAKMMKGKLLIPLQFGLKTFLPSSTQSTSKVPSSNISKGIFTVLLDPGHGGPDIGAQGKGGLNEKDINLDIAKKVREKLQNEGIKVLMTRNNNDEFITLWGRTNLSQKLGPHLFISIHTNAARRKNVSGCEIFYFAEANPKLNGPQYRQNRAKSYHLARLVQKNLFKTLHNQSRGVKSARFFVLRNARTPAILIEVGFITHPKEAQNLNHSHYRNKIATAIVQSVLDFKAKKK
ncbi:MAG: N-acetylmuramoyl-L-alanine amidase [Chlamydiae bacterium]|nr:N-acetylmuramoyl-L-alanine amidase [Chlamydiota bacterium]MBI3277678.1 N-acetylmuramoyl-L-alanine amidase [Chlamydiota bacterium]